MRIESEQGQRLRDQCQENAVTVKTLKGLGEALAKIDRPGSFAVSGSVPAVLPGLAVEGLGTIGLPLTARQASELKKHCHQAPYGKGEKTLVDKNVRRVWRMEPDRFSLTNPDWKRFLAETVGTDWPLQTAHRACELKWTPPVTI